MASPVLSSFSATDHKHRYLSSIHGARWMMNVSHVLSYVMYQIESFIPVGGVRNAAKKQRLPSRFEFWHWYCNAPLNRKGCLVFSRTLYIPHGVLIKWVRQIWRMNSWVRHCLFQWSSFLLKSWRGDYRIQAWRCLYLVSANLQRLVQQGNPPFIRDPTIMKRFISVTVSSRPMALSTDP